MVGKGGVQEWLLSFQSLGSTATWTVVCILRRIDDLRNSSAHVGVEPPFADSPHSAAVPG